jgi:Beta-lactamase
MMRAPVIFLTLIVFVSMGGGLVEARNCRDETPLPADVRLVPPGPDVPPAAARFAGVWVGPWKDNTSDTACATLVVEELLSTGHARVTYGHGAWEPLRITQPRFFRATGRIVDGVLHFVLPVPDRPPFAYKFAPDGSLSGTFRGGGNHAVIRAADLNGIGCRAQVARVTSPSAVSGPRDRLSATELLASSPAGDGPIHNDYFMPLGPTAAARHALRGTLAIAASSMTSGYQGCRGLATPTPSVTIDVFTHGEHLVPVVRGIVGSPKTLIVSPGRVWSEPGDQGMSRASFPLVLVNEFNNGVRNGLATFLFDDRRVSALRFQIGQETMPWARYDYWGQAPMTYTPHTIADEAALRARFAEELRRQASIRPWAALPTGARGPLRDGIDGEVPAEDVSASGLIVDGVAYVHGCNTRYGAYPYCREMRHGAFSVTKSLGAAVALLRLAQKYGDAVFDAKVKDYVTVTAPHDGWEPVTFADALSMATGIGELSPQRQPNDFTADENKPRMFEWITKRSAKEKLEAGFAYPKYPWGHGEVARYNSVHTFILAAAMDAYLKRHAGPNARLWDMVVREVLEPIGILHAPMMHTLETDGSPGIPLLAYGLYPTIDDIAKLTTLLQSDGRHEGRQLLSATKLAEALYRTSAAGGLPIGATYREGEARYNLSFWSVPYRTATGCFFQIPYMSGYGGNLVVLLPNRVSAFRFADAMSYDVEGMILAGESVRPFCAAAVGSAMPAPRAPLTAAELRAEMVGHVFDSGFARLVIDRSGLVSFESKSDFDIGRWHITDDGQYCRTWNVLDRARQRCYRLYRDGESFELHPVDRWGITKLRRVN